jgi:hypothetical protein
MSKSSSVYEYFSLVLLMKFMKLKGLFPVAGAVAFYKIKLKKKGNKMYIGYKNRSVYTNL